tara:strand:+ start:1190 stop:1570 length:381 start_codon:yes stop_codon:yes gene_type:complete
MNLDLAIKNALRRGPMDNAMHSVSSNYGQTFELHAYHQDVKSAEDLMGVKLGNINDAPNFSQKNDRVIPWANGVHHADTLPSTPLPIAKRDNLGNKITYPFGNPIGQSYAAPVNLNGATLLQRRKF